MVRINVIYDGGSSYDATIVPRTIEVEGEEGQPFVEALGRAIGNETKPLIVADVDGDGRDEYVLGTIGTATMGDIAEFANGQSLHLEVAGVGGGLVPSIVEWILAGLTMLDVIDRARRGGDAVVDVLNRHQREAARRWVIEGSEKAPSIELRQMVNRESEWLLSDIERVFGLETGRAAELLRIVGFVEVSTTPSTWRDLRE